MMGIIQTQVKSADGGGEDVDLKSMNWNFTYDSMSFQIFFVVKLNVDLYRNNENDQDGKHFKHIELDSYLDNWRTKYLNVYLFP